MYVMNECYIVIIISTNTTEYIIVPLEIGIISEQYLVT